MALVGPPAGAQTPAIMANAEGTVRVEYDLNTGLADILFGGAKRISGAQAEVKLGSNLVRSTGYSKRVLTSTDIQDGNGRGKRYEITCTGASAGTMKQVFQLYDGRNFLLTQVRMEGSGLSSNWMAPLVTEVAGGVDIGGGSDLRALEVPWDNDRSIRYNAGPLNRTATSYEVSAFYDNASRHGLVTGSVTHDLWKSGIDFVGAGGKLNRLAVYGGAGGAGTRDVNPHGSVRGDSIQSPRMFVGFFDDWRDGLEAFGDANAAQEPRLAWSGPQPFAFNTWGEMQESLTEAKVVSVSDFYKNNLQNNGFQSQGIAYINLDAGNAQLGDAGLRRFTAHCKANGQKAGTYKSIFFYQGDGTGDVAASLIHDSAGNLIRSPDQNACSRDPTHPLTRESVRNFITTSIDQGFEYVKLDFMSYGMKEAPKGKWYDPSVMTGTQAFIQGMHYVDSLAAGRLHINLSISALFPYAQAHSRRISCDAFGNIGAITYMLNSASYGWWMGGRTFTFNDPDHLVLARWSENEARSRYTSGVITGGNMILGDDFSNVARQDRAKRLATVAAINDVVRLRKPFRPVEGNTGNQPADVFELHHDGYLYVAVFNFANSQATKTVPLSRLGMTAASASFDELWTGTKSTAAGSLKTTLAAYDCRLFKSSEAVVAIAKPKPAGAKIGMRPPARAVNALGMELPMRLRSTRTGIPAAGWYATPDRQGTQAR